MIQRSKSSFKCENIERKQTTYIYKSIDYIYDVSKYVPRYHLYLRFARRRSNYILAVDFYARTENKLPTCIWFRA